MAACQDSGVVLALVRGVPTPKSALLALSWLAACEAAPPGQGAAPRPELVTSRRPAAAAKADAVLGGDALTITLRFPDGLQVLAQVDGSHETVDLAISRRDGAPPILGAASAAMLADLAVQAPAGQEGSADEREVRAALLARLAMIPPGTDLTMFSTPADGPRAEKPARRARIVSLCDRIGQEVLTRSAAAPEGKLDTIGPPPFSEDCFGRCGWGCDWHWLRNRYAQDCADHDACSRDLGWSSYACLTQLRTTFDDALFAPNCY
jgi:hypothetical protein